MWGNLGLIALQRGNVIRAKQYFENALSIQQERGNDLDGAMTLNNLSLACLETGELREAEEFARKALEIQHKNESPEFAESLDTLGTVLLKEGKLSEAKETLSRALQIEEKTGRRSLDVAESMHHLAEIHQAEGDSRQAATEYAAAAEIRSTMAPASAAYAESLASLGNVALEEGRLDDSLENYEEATYVLERQSSVLGGPRESVRFHGKYTEYYRQLIDVLMREKKVDRAFETLERSRAQSLLQMLKEGSVSIHAGASPALLERERELQRSLATLANQRVTILLQQRTEADRTEQQGLQEGQGLADIEKKIADVLAEGERVRAQMAEESPRYTSLIRPKQLRLYEIQQLIDPQTLVLEYSLGVQRSYLFVLSRDRLLSFEIGGRRAIERLAREIHDSWSVRNPRRAGIDQASTELCNVILAPAANVIRNYPRLLIVADGALEYIPFAALSLPTEGSGELRALVDDHVIAYVNSASQLSISSQERRKYRTTVAIFADPVFSKDDPRIVGVNTGTQVVPPGIDPKDVDRSVPDAEAEPEPVRALHLSRLIYSRQEAQAISAVVPRGKVLQYMDFEANRKNVNSPALRNSRIVHIATHGFLDSRDPQLSGLVFSEVDRLGRAQVGFYGLEDIFNADLPVDLVVLSACQTALGEEVDGEGLIGLTWGFMYAGARRVLASLWNVDDAATAELMRLFYSAMEREELPPAAALRRAQREMSREASWASPYYWAGFIVHGG